MAMASQDGNIRCKQILLAKYSSEFVTEGDFQVAETEIEAGVKAGSADVLIQNLWFSVDPWTRLCMHDTTQGLYMPPFELGKPIPVLVVAKVVLSDNLKYEPGDFVTGLATASEYALVVGGKDLFGNDLLKVDGNVAPLHYYLGFLGFPGFTAWIGLVRIAQAKPGDEVFVSAASGGVGLAVGQLAKIKGCRVVGTAGSDEKVRLLKEQFGFDDAFNYKAETDWNATLGKLFPNGIDIYFDNIGGNMLGAALNHIKHHARIALCGMISQYNKDWREAEGIRNLINLVGRCAKMEGFLAIDHYEYFEDFVKEMLSSIKEGKITCRESITEGIENFPSAFVGMMKGKNLGKALVHIRDPSS